MINEAVYFELIDVVDCQFWRLRFGGWGVEGGLCVYWFWYWLVVFFKLFFLFNRVLKFVFILVYFFQFLNDYRNQVSDEVVGFKG